MIFQKADTEKMNTVVIKDNCEQNKYENLV
jgi:hypothetical protein